MYCPKCGAANADQASFCERCGANLRSGGQEAKPVATVMPSAVTYAGFWKRFGAIIIDGLIVGAANSILVAVSFGVLYPAVFVTGWLYFALMESSSKQATLGKMALGIIVTDMDGKRISFGKATGRFFARIISF